MDRMVSWDEIGLLPYIKTNIEHRGDVNPFVWGKVLPVFVAPMTCIVNDNNIEDFSKGFIPIMPVRYDRPLYSPGYWNAVTLDEFESRFLDCKDTEWKLCIDTANGHMSKIFDLVWKFKDNNPKSEVMIGNIANPTTYRDCCKAGVDYVRVGIGGGNGCTTSCLTGFHSSLPWLLYEIGKIKEHNPDCVNTKVVADGGIDRIDKAIKALAMGADYVMMGKRFAQCSNVVTGTKLYYGQSSEQGQKDRFGYVKSAPEGIAKWVPIISTIDEFHDSFEAALRSAMSYTDARTLKEFVGEVVWMVQSKAEFDSYFK